MSILQVQLAVKCQAAQPVAGADQAIESALEVCVVFGAFQFTSGLTAPAAWRLSSSPLGALRV